MSIDNPIIKTLPVLEMSGWTFKIGDCVAKKSGSKWTGRVVGFYSSSLTEQGYVVESEKKVGSVQIFSERDLVEHITDDF